MLSAMLFCDRPLTGWPGKGIEKLSNQFPEGTKLKDVIDAIKRHHPALADHWFSGIGHRLMLTESQILVSVLLSLIEQEITALPVHDCLIAAKGDAEEVERVMCDRFEECTSQPASVSRE